MSRKYFYGFLFLGTSTLVFGVTSALLYFGGAKDPIIRAKMLMAHTPENQRLVAHARQLSAAVLERTKGQLSLELVFPPDKQRDGNDFDWAAERLNLGEYQMSQISISSLSRFGSSIGFLEAPFLFSDHPHAAEVFDGEIGAEISERYLAQSKTIRPLAFTYSGGFRIMVSNERLSKVEDLIGLKARIPFSSAHNVAADKSIRGLTLSSLGISGKLIGFKNGAVSELDLFRSSEINFSEDHYSHYTRLYKKYGIVSRKMGYVLETNHSLFLTAIVVSQSFHQSLSKEHQEILEDEAQQLALRERTDSIAVDQAAKEWLQVSGYTVEVPSPEFQFDLKEKTKAVYSEIANRPGAEILERIRNLKKSSLALKDNPATGK